MASGLLLLVVLSLFATQSLGTVVRWAHPVDGFWHDPLAWTPAGHVPTSFDDVFITLPGNYTITIIGNLASSHNSTQQSSSAAVVATSNVVDAEFLNLEIGCPAGPNNSTAKTATANATANADASAMLLDIRGRLFVGDSLHVAKNGVLKLQDEAIAFGPGSITVDDGGELILCGSRASVGVGNDVEIQDGGELRVVWFSTSDITNHQAHSASRHCVPLGGPSSTSSSTTSISSSSSSSSSSTSSSSSSSSCFPSSTNLGDQPLPIIDPVFGIPLALSEASIFVPSTVGQNRVLSIAEHSAVVDVVARQFSQLGGGATTVPAFGMWISEENNQLVRERVTIVTVSIDIQREDLKRAVRQIAQNLAEKLDQEAVFVKLNNIAYLVRQR